jgi:hypothetical protein
MKFAKLVFFSDETRTVIHAHNIKAWIMRYDLTDFEWSVIEPLLRLDRRGPKPKNHGRIIDAMIYALPAGSP